MLAVFNGEDSENMFLGIKLINNAVITEPDGVFSLMVPHKGFTLKGMSGQKSYFVQHSF